jgi:hypothetical protein
MLRTALEGKEPVLFTPPAHCVFCGRQRPMELADTWMCSRCKRKTLYELFCKFMLPDRSGRKGADS